MNGIIELIRNNDEDEGIISKLVWLNTDPEDRTYSEANVSDALDWIEEDDFVEIDSMEKFRNISEGRLELFEVTGPQTTVNCIEMIFYERCNCAAVEEANREVWE